MYFLALKKKAFGYKQWSLKKDSVTCLGVEYAQRRDDTHLFIKSNEENKMLYSLDR